MIIPALLAALTILVLLIVYIFFWVRRMVPGKKALRILLTLVLSASSLMVFTTPGMVMLHFWILSMVWELPLLILRKCTGKQTGKAIRILVPAVITAAAAVWGIYNMTHPIQTNYVYETDKPIRAEGYRLVLITDTHYDTIQDPQLLKDAVPVINSLNPDLVVLCGDIVEEGTSKERMQEVFQVLGGIETSFGTYYAFGNHDRQAYSRSPKYTVDELMDAITGNGITVLKNQYVTLNDEIVLVGMEDPSWHRDNPRIPAADVLAGADLSKLVIFADHQPNDWKNNSAAGMDLQLSGHTHAGQIWPAGFFLELFGGLNYGRYDRDGCTAFVSSGFTGWGFTMRTSQRAEYVVIDIAAK